MAKFSLTDYYKKKVLSKKITKALDKATSAKAMKELGEDAKADLVKQIRSGKITTKNEGTPQKLKKNKPSTVKGRSYAQKRGDLNSKTSPSRANLTYRKTDGLLENGLEVEASKGRFTIKVKRQYRKQVEGLVRSNRNFLHLSKGQVLKALKRLRTALWRFIKT